MGYDRLAGPRDLELGGKDGVGLVEINGDGTPLDALDEELGACCNTIIGVWAAS